MFQKLTKKFSREKWSNSNSSVFSVFFQLIIADSQIGWKPLLLPKDYFAASFLPVQQTRTLPLRSWINSHGSSGLLQLYLGHGVHGRLAFHYSMGALLYQSFPMWMVVCHRNWHCRISIRIHIGLYLQLLLLQSTQVLKRIKRREKSVQSSILDPQRLPQCLKITQNVAFEF